MIIVLSMRRAVTWIKLKSTQSQLIRVKNKSTYNFSLLLAALLDFLLPYIPSASAPRIGPFIPHNVSLSTLLAVFLDFLLPYIPGASAPHIGPFIPLNVSLSTLLAALLGLLLPYPRCFRSPYWSLHSPECESLHGSY